MKFFRLFVSVVFVLIVLSFVAPLHKTEASSFYYHTTLNGYEQYPSLSNPGEFPLMVIKTTITQTGNFCVQAQATADKDNTTIYTWDDTIVSANGGCLNVTNSSTGHSFFDINHYDNTYGSHLAQVRYKINGGAWVYSPTYAWEINVPLSVNANPSIVPLNGTSTISFSGFGSFGGTDLCFQSDQNGNNVDTNVYPANGSFQVVVPNQVPNLFWVSCEDNDYGIATKMVSIQTLPVVTISASNYNINYGGSTSVSFSSDYAPDTCYITDSGGNTYQEPSPKTISPTSTRTYTATCIRNGVSVSSSPITITVGNPPSFIFNFAKEPIIKNLVKANSTDLIGKAYFRLSLENIPSGMSCEVRKNNQNITTKNTNGSWPFVFDALSNGETNFKTVCFPGNGTQIPSEILYISGQSGVLNSTNSSCVIPENGSSCTNHPITWTTTNGMAGFPTEVILNESIIKYLEGTGGTSTINIPGSGVISNGGTTGVATFNSRNKVDGENTGSIVTNILDDLNVTVSCISGTNWNGTICEPIPPATFTVTPSATTGGTISPNTPVVVNPNATTSFTITPNDGYTPSIEGTCPPGTLNGTNYTTGAIIGNCTVIATFTAQPTGTINATDCIIASGESNCASTITWNTVNPLSGVTSAVTTPTDITVATGNSNPASPVTVYPIDPVITYFFLYHNGVELDQDFAIATCVNGTAWNGTICTPAVTDPIINNPTATNIGMSTATLGANIVSLGNPVRTIRGVCYGRNIRPTQGQSGVACFDAPGAATTGEYTIDTNLLSAGTLYYSRGFIKNTTGNVSYSQDTSFTTLNTGQQLTITKIGSGSGTVSSNPSGISCGRICSNGFTTGTVVTLTTTPDADSNFSGWSGNPDCSDGSVRMTSNINCTATFNLKVNPSGTISASDCSIPLGGNSCNTLLNWNTLNPLPRVTSAVTTPVNITVKVANSATNFSYNIYHGTRDFYLYHNGVLLGQDPATAACVNGTTWDIPSSSCVATVIQYTVKGVAGINGTVTPASQIVNSGSTATLTITPNSGYTATATGCGGSLSGTRYTTGVINTNCTVTATFVTSPSGNISATNCIIASGASTCNTLLNWNTLNPLPGVTSAVTSSYPTPGTVVYNGNSGVNKSAVVPYSFRTFYLYNGYELAQTRATATCISGTDWNGTICAPYAPNLTSAVPTPATATAGVSKTYTARISNNGNANATASNYFWQTSTSANMGGTVTDKPSAVLGAINVGSYIDVTTTHTFATAGTYSIQVCADKTSSAGGGVLTESNEGDNCNYTNVTVTPPSVPVVTITANPTSGPVGTNPALTWSATNSPTSCTASGSWSGTKPTSGTSVSQGALNTVGTYTYTLVCSNASGNSAPASATVIISATLPNLTPAAPTPATATAGVSKTYTARISNNGTANAAASNYFWQTSTSANMGGTVTDKPSAVLGAINVGNFIDVTTTHTFASVGTYSIQVCADKTSSAGGGVLTESNEGDNCNYTNVTVTVPPIGMTGTLTGSPCTIALGANSCTTTLSWNVTNPEVVLGSNVTSNTNNSGATSPNFIIAPPVTTGTVDSGTKTSVAVPYSSRTFFLNNNGKSLVPTAESPSGSGVVITASCGVNVWDGAKCVVGTPVNGLCSNPNAHYICGIGNSINRSEDINYYYWDCEGTGGGTTDSCKELKGGGGGTVVIDYFTATPANVLKGRSSVLSWSAPTATSCTGTNFDTGNSNIGSTTVFPPATTIYTLTCTDGGSSNPTSEAIIQVIVPVIIEN